MIFGVSSGKVLLGVVQTLYMVSASLLIGLVFAVPLAVLLVITRKGGIKECRILYSALYAVINIIRSVPFIILIVYIMPFTKFLIGTRIGSTAAIVPLVFYIAPYLSRLIETSLLDVNEGITETAQALGATTFQTIVHFLLPEAALSIILAVTTGAVGLLGATAMAGAVGGGGVGDLALTYGYQRFNTPLMTATVILLVVFVQLIQLLGSKISSRTRHVK